MTTLPFAAVYLARHGQTTWNVEGRRQGRLDSPLTGLGLDQAAALAACLTGQEVDAVFTSPLVRASTTAATVAGALGLPLTEVAGLVELDHGDWSGLTDLDIDRLFPGARDARSADKYRWVFPGGESYRDGQRRARMALSDIAAAGSRRPLLVTHEMIGRMIAGSLAGLSPAAAIAGRYPNGAVHRWRPGEAELLRLPETPPERGPS